MVVGSEWRIFAWWCAIGAGALVLGIMALGEVFGKDDSLAGGGFLVMLLGGLMLKGAFWYAVVGWVIRVAGSGVKAARGQVKACPDCGKRSVPRDARVCGACGYRWDVRPS